MMPLHRLQAVVLLVTLAAVPRAAAAAPDQNDRVAEAIASAVRQRMGLDARVEVAGIRTSGLTRDGAIEAVPDPAAKIGGEIGFSLVASQGIGAQAHAVAAGRAVAHVTVAVPHVVAGVLLARGRIIEAADLTESSSEVDGVPVRHLPTAAEIIGSTALRPIARNEIITATAVTVQPAVRSGQIVRAVARVDNTEVSAMVVAAQSGEPGAIIRVVNRESRRELHARVLAEGLVQVVP